MTVELPLRKAKKVYCVYGVLSNYYQQLLFILQGTKTGSSGTLVLTIFMSSQQPSFVLVITTQLSHCMYYSCSINSLYCVSLFI